MSRVFYDHLLELDELEEYINNVAETKEEKIELWHIVDEIIHHRVLGCVLDHLPKQHHEPFVENFKNKPHSEELIIYVNEKIEHDIEEKIRSNITKMQKELLKELGE